MYGWIYENVDCDEEPILSLNHKNKKQCKDLCNTSPGCQYFAFWPDRNLCKTYRTCETQSPIGDEYILIYKRLNSNHNSVSLWNYHLRELFQNYYCCKYDATNFAWEDIVSVKRLKLIAESSRRMITRTRVTQKLLDTRTRSMLCARKPRFSLLARRLRAQAISARILRIARALRAQGVRKSCAIIPLQRSLRQPKLNYFFAEKSKLKNEIYFVVLESTPFFFTIQQKHYRVSFSFQFSIIILYAYWTFTITSDVGDISSRDALESISGYHEIVLENPANFTMYTGSYLLKSK